MRWTHAPLCITVYNQNLSLKTVLLFETETKKLKKLVFRFVLRRSD